MKILFFTICCFFSILTRCQVFEDNNLKAEFYYLNEDSILIVHLINKSDSDILFLKPMWDFDFMRDKWFSNDTVVISNNIRGWWQYDVYRPPLNEKLHFAKLLNSSDYTFYYKINFSNILNKYHNYFKIHYFFEYILIPTNNNLNFEGKECYKVTKILNKKKKIKIVQVDKYVSIKYLFNQLIIE